MRRKQMDTKQLENDFNTLSNRIMKLDKWNRFREQRAKVINQYILTKRTIRKKERMYALVVLLKILAKIREGVK